jgi:hypothetical protein
MMRSIGETGARGGVPRDRRPGAVLRWSAVATALLMLAACDVPPDEGPEPQTKGVEVQTSALRLSTGTLSTQFGGDGSQDQSACIFAIFGCLNTGGLNAPPFQAPARGRLIKLLVWSGDYVDGIEMFWQDLANPMNIIWSGHQGGWGGSVTTVEMAAGEVITGAGVRHGQFVDALKIWTSTGRVLRMGGWGGGFDMFNTPAGAEIHGFNGIAGQYIDALAAWAYQP